MAAPPAFALERPSQVVATGRPRARPAMDLKATPVCSIGMCR